MEVPAFSRHPGEVDALGTKRYDDRPNGRGDSATDKVSLGRRSTFS